MPRKSSVQLHESFSRLIGFAETALGGDPLQEFEIRNRLGVSPATFTNWKARGVSESGAIRAQQVFGCSVNWVLHNVGEAKATGIATEPALTLPPAPQPKPMRQVTESQFQMLEDFELLSDEEKHTLRVRLAEKARAARERADEFFFGKHKIPPPVSNERIEETYGAPPAPSAKPRPQLPPRSRSTHVPAKKKGAK